MADPFFLGSRVGATPLIGNTLRAHYIDPDSQVSICGVWTTQGWSPANPGSATSTDLSAVTCGACLGWLSRSYSVPANAI